MRNISINWSGVGVRIRAIRGRMTQSEFIKTGVHCSQQLLSKYESGSVKPPNEVLLEISKIGHTSVDYLLTGEKALEMSATVAESVVPYGQPLSHTEKDLIRLFRNAPDSARGKAIGYLEASQNKRRRPQ